MCLNPKIKDYTRFTALIHVNIVYGVEKSLFLACYACIRIFTESQVKVCENLEHFDLFRLE